MLVSRSVIDHLKERAVAAEAKNATLERHNTALEASLEWMRLRISQIEHERALLLYKFMDIKLDVPEIARKPVAPSPETAEALHATLDFNDVGDDMATKLGIGWNADGSIRYQTPE